MTAQSPKPIKRFYESASAQEKQDGFWRVLLDSKPVRTPKGSLLDIPSKNLAQAVALEWQAQGETVRPLDMPLTTLGCTAIDLVRPELDDGSCVRRLLPFLETDTVCFEDDQEALAAMQRAEWGPLRQWFEERFGLTLAVGRGFTAPCHPEYTLTSVEKALAARSEWDLCAIEVATSTAKSLIVAVALVDKPDMAAEDALRWALLEEHFQIERWGLVEGEHDVAHSEALKWLRASREFVCAIREG